VEPGVSLTHATLGSRASVGKKFNGTGAYIDPAGNVYVVDYANSRVQKFNASGTYLTQWGSPGSGNGQFATPYQIAGEPLPAGLYFVRSSSRVGSR